MATPPICFRPGGFARLRSAMGQPADLTSLAFRKHVGKARSQGEAPCFQLLKRGRSSGKPWPSCLRSWGRFGPSPTGCGHLRRGPLLCWWSSALRAAAEKRLAPAESVVGANFSARLSTVPCRCDRQPGRLHPHCRCCSADPLCQHCVGHEGLPCTGRIGGGRTRGAGLTGGYTVLAAD